MVNRVKRFGCYEAKRCERIMWKNKLHRAPSDSNVRSKIFHDEYQFCLRHTYDAFLFHVSRKYTLDSCWAKAFSTMQIQSSLDFENKKHDQR